MERKRALGGQKEKGSREGLRWKEKERLWSEGEGKKRGCELERNRAQSGQKEKGSREGLRWKETEQRVVRRRREVERV